MKKQARNINSNILTLSLKFCVLSYLERGSGGKRGGGGGGGGDEEEEQDITQEEATIGDRKDVEDLKENRVVKIDKMEK